MKKYSDFDKYEQEITKELQRLFPNEYTPESAQRKVEEYYEVMERVGWFCTPEEWANNLHSVISKGISPEDWKKNLDQIDQHVDFPETNSNVSTDVSSFISYKELEKFIKINLPMETIMSIPVCKTVTSETLISSFIQHYENNGLYKTDEKPKFRRKKQISKTVLSMRDN